MTRNELRSQLLLNGWDVRLVAGVFGVKRHWIYKKIKRHGLLRPKTYLKNTRDRVKTVCKRGHPFDEQTTRINRRGHRVCRKCDRDRKRSDGPRQDIGPGQVETTLQDYTASPTIHIYGDPNAKKTSRLQS